MLIGPRIAERLHSVGISQAELARRVGVSQQAIGKLIHGESRKTTHIVRIARELGTTPAFLEGETDDPDANAPAPPATPRHQFVTLQVALPSEDALARMFEGLLRSTGMEAGVDALSRTLAKRLPTGLSQLRDLLPPVSMDGPPLPRADPPPRGKARPAPPPSPRT